MRGFGREVATRALAAWDLTPSDLIHLQTSGNDVWRFRDGDAPRILRLTDPAHRPSAANAAEMAFVRHLAREGVAVSEPLPSRSGALVETVGECSASVLTWAPGEIVGPETQHWNEAFFRAWGGALAAIHAAARGYAGPARWDWEDEDLIRRADSLLPADDPAPRRELARVREALADLPRSPASWGMTHADHGPQNFHYAPATGVTSFDFGNCCRHWYAMDVTIALSTLRRQPDRDRLRDWLLAGYRARLPLDAAAWAHFPWLLRLRVLYVYLSRLAHFGPAPDAGQRLALARLRALVAEPVTWP